MRFSFSFIFAAILSFGLVPGAGVSTANAQQDKTDLQRSTSRATSNQRFELRYKMQTGDILRWTVEQIASTETRMAGHEEKSSLRSRSVHAWTVQSVDSIGNMTFQNQLESATEWQKVGDDDPISYDSSKNDKIPDIYLPTSEKIGKPIATITINPLGETVSRVDLIKTPELGMGSITTPMPERSLAIGDQWDIPEDIQARRKDKSLKTIKSRVLYTLRSVENGIATISFRREMLTPIEDPWIEMQLQQKMNQGSILFDIAKGCVAKKIVQWDEQVQGFEGNDSFLRYLGSYTMELSTTPATPVTSSKPLTPLVPKTSDRSTTFIKPADGKPIIRK